MTYLPDGAYDVIVVDVESLDHGDVRIELTITLGPYVGDIAVLRRRSQVEVDEAFAGRDPLELLGVCGTLHVKQGQPVFRPERA